MRRRNNVREPRPPLLRGTIQDRIVSVNAILNSITHCWHTRLLVYIEQDRRGRLWVCWVDRTIPGNPETNKALWVDTGHTYPRRCDRWPWGGTQTMFIHQLCRWIEGRPCFGADQPMVYWGRELSKPEDRDRTEELIRATLHKENTCVICGKTPPKGLDWWHGDTVVGPICSMNNDKDYCWRGKIVPDIEKEKRAKCTKRKAV